MSYYAKISDNQMQVLIENGFQLRHQCEALVGEQLLDFIYYDLRKLNHALGQAYSSAVFMKDPDFYGFLNKLDLQNIYLRYFVELLLNTILFEKPTTKAGFDALKTQFPQEIELLQQNDKFKNLTHRTIYSSFLIGIFGVHALRIQSFMKEHLEFCVEGSNNSQYLDLSPIERLYIYEQWRKDRGEEPYYFETDSFCSKLVISDEIKSDGEFSIEELADKLKKQKPQIAEMTVLPTSLALMRYELMKMITLGMFVKKCANCKRYFILMGRSDIEYCNRPLNDQPEKTCHDIGAQKKYMDKVQTDPIRKEFHKAYRRNHSRVCTGSMTQTEFLKWSDEARIKRDDCIVGKIVMGDFIEWINSDRRYKIQSN